MKKFFCFGVFGLYLLLLLGTGGPTQAAPLGTAFNYQGRLAFGSSPANGIYDFQFILFDSLNGGTQVGIPIILDNVTVSNGLFMVQVDFGDGMFTGDARYLEIHLRPGTSAGGYTTLSPRQTLSPVPYALSVAVPLSLTGSAPGVGIISGSNTSSTTGFGVKGTFNGSSAGAGVGGYASSNTGVGVVGASDGSSGTGVLGVATKSSGVGVAGSGGLYDFFATGPGANYGPFTGAHDVKLAPNFPEEVVPGMIVSVQGKVEVRRGEDGKVSLSSTLPTVMLSAKARDKAVFGVLVSDSPLFKGHWYEPKPGERFAVVNALGEGRVWVTNANGDIEAGDYITTSAIPGYGAKQADDILHSYTLGKATETVDWGTVTDTITSNGQTYKVYLIGVVYTSG